MWLVFTVVSVDPAAAVDEDEGWAGTVARRFPEAEHLLLAVRPVRDCQMNLDGILRLFHHLHRPLEGGLLAERLSIRSQVRRAPPATRTVVVSGGSKLGLRVGRQMRLRDELDGWSTGAGNENEHTRGGQRGCRGDRGHAMAGRHAGQEANATPIQP